MGHEKTIAKENQINYQGKNSKLQKAYYKPKIEICLAVSFL
jgi:hypothetical protein